MPATGQLTRPLNANVAAAAAFRAQAAPVLETVHAVNIAKPHEPERREREDADSCAEVAAVNGDQELIREQLVGWLDRAIGGVIVQRVGRADGFDASRQSFGERLLHDE